MIPKISFTSSYTIKIKSPKNHNYPTEKEKRKAENADRFLDVVFPLSKRLQGASLFVNLKSDKKTPYYQTGSVTLKVPDTEDSTVENLLEQNEVTKYKKHN